MSSLTLPRYYLSIVICFLSLLTCLLTYKLTLELLMLDLLLFWELITFIPLSKYNLKYFYEKISDFINFSDFCFYAFASH